MIKISMPDLYRWLGLVLIGSILLASCGQQGQDKKIVMTRNTTVGPIELVISGNMFDAIVADQTVCQENDSAHYALHITGKGTNVDGLKYELFLSASSYSGSPGRYSLESQNTAIQVTSDNPEPAEILYLTIVIGSITVYNDQKSGHLTFTAKGRRVFVAPNLLMGGRDPVFRNVVLHIAGEWKCL